MNPTIDYLCNHPKFIKDVATYIWNYWKDDYEELTNIKTLDDMVEFYSNTYKDKYPIVYIIFCDNILIGTITIDKEDMGLYTHLEPWMVSVFIDPEYRNMGYASCLINFVVEKYPLLHLWTYNDRYAKFYNRFGFKTIDIVEKYGKYTNIIVMKKNI